MTLLGDLHVVELATELTATAGRVLAQLGAEVVAVEPPGGSELRSRPPFVDDVPDREASLAWWADAAGKRSVVADLEVAEGQERLAALVAWADVVIESEGRRLDELGVGPGRFRADQPRLVWVSITPFGRESARAGPPFTDLTLLAGGGPLWNCGYDDHSIPPIRGAGGQALNTAGLYGAIGALTAVAHRDLTGEGQLVDVNALAACNVTSEQATFNWLVVEEICTRQTGRHAYHTPSAPVQVRCADGAYATTGVLPMQPRDFAELHRWMTELGILDQLPEAIFIEAAAAREEPIDLSLIGVDDEITAMLSAAREGMALVAASLPAVEFFEQSQRRGFPAGAILAPDEAFAAPHTEARHFPMDVEVPERRATYRFPGSPYLVDSEPLDPLVRPPRLDEHRAELLGNQETGP